jgi:Peptidase family M41/ATPase family associated with various cellular activities (AAA)/AAA+ lid domain
MFVGVGAARVRDLFEQARKEAPAIVFIDELDALGGARGAFVYGGNSEKEQTLNQLLVEMDGFDPSIGVILLAATNRPEILDPALLRAGRFDRQILVDRPDKKDRIAILAVHLKKAVLASDVDPKQIAELTPGFTGADLANLVNEAALLATRRGADSVHLRDFTAAVERIVAGLEKKNRLLIPKERKIVAYHELGHAIVAMALPEQDPVHKISIIPRGIGALGYTIQRPTEDRFLMTKEELENRMAVLLGGRAAEYIFFHHLSTGAADDLVKATDTARSMVLRYGMDKDLGHVAYERERPPMLGMPAQPNPYAREFSDETERLMDHAIRGLPTKPSTGRSKSSTHTGQCTRGPRSCCYRRRRSRRMISRRCGRRSSRPKRTLSRRTCRIHRSPRASVSRLRWSEAKRETAAAKSARAERRGARADRAWRAARRPLLSGWKKLLNWRTIRWDCHGERRSHRPAHEGVTAWNAWREQNPHIRPDLSGADLPSVRPIGVQRSATSPQARRYFRPRSSSRHSAP